MQTARIIITIVGVILLIVSMLNNANLVHKVLKNEHNVNDLAMIFLNSFVIMISTFMFTVGILTYYMYL